jgi:uncharacterized protein
MGPISAGERVQAIDILRGFALFGIIAANMRGFAGPVEVYFNWRLLWNGTADVVAQTAIDALISGKFITLFAFLFGLGFAVQMDRTRERGQAIAGLYSRRLTILLLFGAAHVLLLWWGDILVPYALVGFLLLLFRNRSQKALLIWAIGISLVPVLIMTTLYTLVQFGVTIPSPPRPKPEAIQHALRIYSQGGWVEIFRQRIADWIFLNRMFLFPIVFVLPRFLFGVYVWRSGFIQNLAGREATLRKIFAGGLAIGLPLNVAGALIVAIMNPNPFAPTLPALVLTVMWQISVPALSAAYAAGIWLLYLSGRRGWVERFAAVGRSALSNYILQSLVATTLFYSYGLRLFGKTGPALGLIPTFAIYAAQVALSNWWFTRFQFGPLEWLWRSLTYGKLQPMRKDEFRVAEAL